MLRDSQHAFYLEFYVNEEYCDLQMLGDLLLTKCFSFLFSCSCSCSWDHYINFRIPSFASKFECTSKIAKSSKNRIESKNRRSTIESSQIDESTCVNVCFDRCTCSRSNYRIIESTNRCVVRRSRKYDPSALEFPYQA